MGERSYRARAVVLRRTKLGETDLIVTLLTDGTSQVRAVAKGARKPGARLAGALGLGSEAELLLRRGRSLDIVSEATLVRSREACACELERSAMMDVVLEVADALTAEGQHGPALLPLTTTALEALEPTATGPGARVGLLPLLGAAYVLKAVYMQGYRPQLDACMLCGEPVGLDREGSVWVAPAEGGLVCEGCLAGVAATRWPARVVAWARSLIGMRFSEVLALPAAPGEASLGLDVLEFCRDWLAHYPGTRPRSLDFVLTLGTYS